VSIDIGGCLSIFTIEVFGVLKNLLLSLVGIKSITSVGRPAQASKSVILKSLFREGNIVDTVVSAFTACVVLIGLGLSFESPEIFVGNIIGA